MKKKILLFILVIVFVYAIGGVVYLKMIKKEPEVVKVESLDTIKGYDYVLKSNDTKYYKGLFNELKKLLESKDVNDEEYAKLISKMFITDLYTLDNKLNKYEVGGAMFVHPDYVDRKSDSVTFSSIILLSLLGLFSKSCFLIICKSISEIFSETNGIDQLKIFI